MDERRAEAVKKAYAVYTLPEFKLWASDKCMELAQQLVRIGTKRSDRGALIRNALMVEDAIGMLWLLHKGYEDEIASAKSAIYTEFEDMIKEEQCCVMSDKEHCISDFKV